MPNDYYNGLPSFYHPNVESHQAGDPWTVLRPDGTFQEVPWNDAGLHTYERDMGGGDYEFTATADPEMIAHKNRQFKTASNQAAIKIAAGILGGTALTGGFAGAGGAGAGVGDVGGATSFTGGIGGDAAGMLEPVTTGGATMLPGGVSGGFLGSLGGESMAAFPALGGAAAEAGGGALAGIAPSGLPSGVGGFTPAGATAASGEYMAPASQGFFGNVGNMVKGAFVNGDGSYNWNNIIKAGGTALGAIGSYNSHPGGAPALPAGWNDRLAPTPLSRHVVGLGSDDAYKNYGVSGGEHNFFQPGPAPSGPATSPRPTQGPNMGFNDPIDFTKEPVMRAGGHYIKGAGTGRSDEIDAKLSNDEYVMDAETVALLGDGSPEAGAKKLDQLRANIRKHKGQQLAKGKFSANAKDPAEYLPVRKAKGGRIRPPMTFNSDLSQAYRGYTIKHNQVNDSFHISKDGSHISSPRSIDEAKKTIDELAGIGELPEKFAKGGTVLRAVPKPAVNEGMRAAQLAAVQRFRDAIKGQVQAVPAVEPLKKAQGGAVKAMNAFAEDLERQVNSGNTARAIQIKAQMDGISPGAGKYFEEGFAKGGKVRGLVESFGKFFNPPIESSMPPKLSLSPEEMAWMVKWLRKNNPDSDALIHFDNSTTPDLRGRVPGAPPAAAPEDVMKILGQE